MPTPEIRFREPFLLFRTLDSVLRPAYKAMDKEQLLERGFFKKKIERYERSWGSYEAKVLTGLSSIYDLKFRHNIIDVYVAPFRNSFSDPMFMRANLTDEELIAEMAHELLHRLLVDNTEYERTDLMSQFISMQDPGLPMLVVNHLPIYAGLQKLYVDVLDEPDAFEREVRSLFDPEYRQAWKLVESIGYEQIINQIRSIPKP